MLFGTAVVFGCSQCSSYLTWYGHTRRRNLSRWGLKLMWQSLCVEAPLNISDTLFCSWIHLLLLLTLTVHLVSSIGSLRSLRRCTSWGLGYKPVSLVSVFIRLVEYYVELLTREFHDYVVLNWLPDNCKGYGRWTRHQCVTGANVALTCSKSYVKSVKAHMDKFTKPETSIQVDHFYQSSVTVSQLFEWIEANVSVAQISSLLLLIWGLNKWPFRIFYF